MKVGIHAGAQDIKGLIEFCKRINVDEICLSASSIDGYKQNGYPDPASLKRVIDALNKAGINVPTMNIGRPSPAALLGELSARGEAEAFRRTVQVVGEAGVYSALYYNRAPAPAPGISEEEQWVRMLAFFRPIIEQAEKSGLRLAAHAYYIPGTMLVWDEATNWRFFEALPSEYNALTYCTKMYMGGDDVYETIPAYGDKIVFAHARDLKRSVDPDYWLRYDETMPGEGDLDWNRVFTLLKGIGYQGLICPEHLGPKRPGQTDQDQLAEAVAYLQKLV
ncbi:MAG: sugar phosphate isomerase/epimerase [Bacteroidetes bacterium]|nr:sugar phosphate isomerase/epimerase [Bacteroidota bacterium]